jgi:hypothetical protein
MTLSHGKQISSISKVLHGSSTVTLKCCQGTEIENQFTLKKYLSDFQSYTSQLTLRIYSGIKKWKVGYYSKKISTALKVSRSWNKIVEPKLLPKNKRTSLFFYPGDPEILETWISILSFKYFRVVRIEKTNSFIHFCEKLQLDNFVSRCADL